jgi:hypothetical protein
VVEALIGPNVLLFGCRPWNKHPRDERFISWHQDNAYFGLDPHDEVTTWTAITKSTRDNGCLRYVPGSICGPTKCTVNRTTRALEALKRTGPAATSTQPRDAIGRLNGFTGICGPYDFVQYPQRGLGLDAAIIYRWDGTRNEFAVISKPAGEPLE